ncbi:MAG TPA: 30S ribosomal protein S18 [Saprospiraceae bacterium]|nr:30S ribosomal protein S18 [Saprospiraceae bacterium]
MASRDDIKFLSNPKIGQKKKKYCRFTKYNLKYVDYKDPDFLKGFLNEQGKLLPRRITGNSLKWQRRVSRAVKRSRHLAMLPYVSDQFK